MNGSNGRGTTKGEGALQAFVGLGHFSRKGSKII